MAVTHCKPFLFIRLPLLAQFLTICIRLRLQLFSKISLCYDNPLVHLLILCLYDEHVCFCSTPSFICVLTSPKLAQGNGRDCFRRFPQVMRISSSHRCLLIMRCVWASTSSLISVLTAPKHACDKGRDYFQRSCIVLHISSLCSYWSLPCHPSPQCFEVSFSFLDPFVYQCFHGTQTYLWWIHVVFKGSILLSIPQVHPLIDNFRSSSVSKCLASMILFIYVFSTQTYLWWIHAVF